MNEDNEDEVVIVELPKSSIKILKEVVRREEAYTWFINKIRNWWVLSVAAGVIILLTLIEKIQDFAHLWSIK